MTFSGARARRSWMSFSRPSRSRRRSSFGHTRQGRRQVLCLLLKPKNRGGREKARRVLLCVCLLKTSGFGDGGRGSMFAGVLLLFFEGNRGHKHAEGTIDRAACTCMYIYIYIQIIYAHMSHVRCRLSFVSCASRESEVGGSVASLAPCARCCSRGWWPS